MIPLELHEILIMIGLIGLPIVLILAKAPKLPNHDGYDSCTVMKTTRCKKCGQRFDPERQRCPGCGESESLKTKTTK